MKRIARSAVDILISRTPILGADCDSRDFNADLFRLMDHRNTIRVRSAAINLIAHEETAVLAAIHQWLKRPTIFEIWASESLEVYSVEFSEPLLRGYIDEAGQFVPQPLLEPIPDYCRTIDFAMSFKEAMFGPYLHLKISQVDGEWGYDYGVCLADGDGKTVASYRADSLPIAIVGSVLHAMASGWTHDLAYYELVDG